MHTKTKDGRAWTVKINETAATVYWQSVNPKTGKGWQRTRDDQYFSGPGFEAKAMRAWLYAGKPTTKTPIVRQAASDLGVECNDIPMIEIEPTAFRGLPVA
jgi:hypothetical protein